MDRSLILVVLVACIVLEITGKAVNGRLDIGSFINYNLL